MNIKNWNIEELTGYKPITTFYQDFSIADNFGISAIKDTFKRAFDEWKDNYKFLTELVMVLNWKIFEHYENDEHIAKVYDSLWREADEYAMENLKNQEAKYYYEIID